MVSLPLVPKQTSQPHGPWSLTPPLSFILQLRCCRVQASHQLVPLFHQILLLDLQVVSLFEDLESFVDQLEE